MNEYRAAGDGLHTMYVGEIVQLVSLAVTFIIPFLGVIGVLIGGIVVLVGLNKAGEAHSGFQTALMLSVVGIVLSLLKSLTGNSAGAASVLGIISGIISCFETYYICTASGSLLKDMGEHTLAEQAEQLWKMVAGCEAVAIGCSLVIWIPVLNILAVFALVITFVVSIVMYFLRIGFYNSASKAFLS